MLVLKIGGTSMGDASRIDQALDIAKEQLDHAPLMVCSAMGGITEKIIESYSLAEARKMAESNAVLSMIKDQHYTCARKFITGNLLNTLITELDTLFAQFASLLKGVGLLRDCSPRSKDALLSFGERLSTLLIHARGKERGMDVELLDARNFIRTDENFTASRPDMDATFLLTKKHVHPKRGRLLITQGFIASGPSGVTTTLGRGGSDYSAGILGAALDAKEIQIWTDVNGIMTGDPRIIASAVTIPEITYEEAAELAFFGAKVVHPATIQPAVAKGIPVLVKNAAMPEAKGTRIATGAGNPGIKAIASKNGVTLLNITSSRMLEAHGFLRRIFAVFDTAETSVDLVTTSEISVSMTIEKTATLPSILKELEPLGTVTVEPENSIICMVGRELWKDTTLAAHAFNALQNIPVRMISLGSSKINLSLVVPEKHAPSALKSLHDRFFNHAP